MEMIEELVQEVEQLLLRTVTEKCSNIDTLRQPLFVSLPRGFTESVSGISLILSQNFRNATWQ